MTTDEKIKQLLNKLENISKRQDGFFIEIFELRKEIIALQEKAQKDEQLKKVETKIENTILEQNQAFQAVKNEIEKEVIVNESVPLQKINTIPLPKQKNNLEKFIGENLVNKIGIIITIIGLAIGTKYSIENNLINPLTRIILGYLAGFILLGVGIKLKQKYQNYSAVLVSGAIANMYFITYAAYSFYNLLPQLLAFILMVCFTAFTIIAAIHYNRQVIAIIGLVGAYAVPFLLSENSGKIVVLFSYMTIINIGILVIAFKKYWKSLYFSSFILSWLILGFWVLDNYNDINYFATNLVFLFIFFLTFYSIFISYKTIQKENFLISDVLILLTNSFIFYLLGYSIIDSHKIGTQLLGLFTIFNAVIHTIVSMLIYKKNLADKNLFYFLMALVLLFVTITIPVQLDGNWVTLLWVVEAALLFGLGKTKSIFIYEKLSYPLMFLAFFSLLHDWSSFYLPYNDFNYIPILNTHFLTSFLFSICFGLIIYYHFSAKYKVEQIKNELVKGLINISIPIIFFTALFFTFRNEIDAYFQQLFNASLIEIKDETSGNSKMIYNYDYQYFKSIWLFNYSLFFFIIISYLNISKFQKSKFGLINIAINYLVITIFLFEGLYILSILRDNYLNQTMAEYYNQSFWYLAIRYISYLFVGTLVYFNYKYSKQNFLNVKSVNLKMIFELSFSLILIWLLSSELISLLSIFNYSETYKISLSVLWGIYSLGIVTYGILKDKKYLRIFAMTLFSVTLIKLFFYDISHLNTISKTIVFVSLGILLLIISFLYNKFKNKIADEN